MRAALADIPDMEKRLVRIPPDAFLLLGIKPGARIVIESTTPVEVADEYTLISGSVPAYELTEATVDRRATLAEPRLDARYPDPEKILGLPEDIWPIYIDAQMRDEIGGFGPMDVVKVRRDFWDLFLTEFREFGIVFFISVFTIATVLPIDITWLSAAIIGICSLSVASLLALVNMRAAS